MKSQRRSPSPRICWLAMWLTDAQQGHHSVPVLRDGTLAGIVTRADLIRALAMRLADR